MKARMFLPNFGKPCRWPLLSLLVLLELFAMAWPPACAQVQSPNASPEGSTVYARKNTFSVLAAYSNDSSHILMGQAENRKLLDFGAGYSRRLWVNRVVNWQYNGEILPVALENDLTGQIVDYQTSPTVATFPVEQLGGVISCAVITSAYSYTVPNLGGTGTTTYAGTEVQTCSGRRWNIGEAISPVGFQWNFLPRLKTQPFFIGHGGYMYSTKPIPVSYAGSFNFTFDVGAGVEWFRTPSQSVRVEYRYHHISNHNTAQYNPGIDNGLFQVTYSFGR
jgi:opacity protein-like surface antigen